MMGIQGQASTAPGPWDSQPKVQAAPAQMPASATYLRIRNFLIVFGVIILTLLIATPVWNASRLMSDSTIVFFLGTSFAAKSIVLCCGSIVAWVILVFLFFRCSREEGLTELSMANLAILVLTALGLGMLLISVPAMGDVDTKYHDIFDSCDTSPSTSTLAAYSSVLQELRQKPACANLDSIEDCEGYEASNPYTGFLKSMEKQFRCAGFCYTAPSSTKLADSSHSSTSTNTSDTGKFYQMPAAASLRDRVLQASFKARAEQSKNSASEDRPQPGHQHVGRKSHGDHEPVMFLMSASEEVERVDANGQEVSSKEAEDSKPSPYPPTLFSLANYQASCDGMAARDIKYSAGQTVRFLYTEGIILIGCSLLVGLFKMCHLCGRAKAGHKPSYA